MPSGEHPRGLVGGFLVLGPSVYCRRVYRSAVRRLDDIPDVCVECSWAVVQNEWVRNPRGFSMSRVGNEGVCRSRIIFAILPC